jgi:hypothetical protein
MPDSRGLLKYHPQHSAFWVPEVREIEAFWRTIGESTAGRGHPLEVCAARSAEQRFAVGLSFDHDGEAFG